MKIKNETEIQLMKILFKTNGSKATKNITSKRAYPFGIEKQYYTKLKSFFKPLTDYVNKYVDENLEQLLRGDSTEIKLDAIPGDSFRDMIYNLENWLSIYMPDISELPSDSNNNVILVSLAKTAEEAKEFGDKEFQKTIEKGIHVNPPVSSSWWGSMRDSWAEDNYTLITSNAKKYVSQINTLTEQAIVNGLSPAKLKAEIKKATEGLSDKHCKLLARDQMGKLNGQITQAQMQELGLDMYVWSTAYDDRVRDSHALMEGLLCRWDDASVCSYDNGKTWVERPSGAVDLHPGQDIQCRCVALSFYPELEAEMEGTSLNEQVEGLEPVQEQSQFEESKFANMPEYLRNNIEELKKEFNYDSDLIFSNPKDYIKYNLVDNDFINPNYENSLYTRKGFKQYQYTENCQRCVPTSYMRYLGFNVTAKPLPKKSPDFDDMLWNWGKFVKNKDGSFVRSVNVSEISTVKNSNDLLKNTIKYIKEQSKSNSFWECKCSWKDGGAHVFSAIYDSVNDEVLFFDPQKGTINIGEATFSKMKLKNFSILRLDDKIIDLEVIKTACKNL